MSFRRLAPAWRRCIVRAKVIKMASHEEKKPLIGFVGQGYVGKNYADDFERRGYDTVRYALEEPYRAGKGKIRECDIVFIAVPTPTTPDGFEYGIVESALSLVGDGKIAVIKSTVLPGTTEALQEKCPSVLLLMSPEFLTEATAAYDAAHPQRNIIGMAKDTSAHRAAAERVLAALPEAPFTQICRAREAEYIKYGGNNWFYFKVLFINALYDLAAHDGCDWDVIKKGIAADPRVGSTHLNPVHASGEPGGGVRHLTYNEIHLEPVHKGGRGAGGPASSRISRPFPACIARPFPRT